MNKWIGVALVSFALIGVQKKLLDWKSVVPLVTTRAQVEANWGSPVAGSGYVVQYETASEKIMVWYGGAKSAENDACRWKVSNDTLFQFVLAPKESVRLSDVNINLASFEKQKAREMVNDYYYYNDNEGITITTRVTDGEELLLNIERGPTSAERKKHCCKDGKDC